MPWKGLDWIGAVLPDPFAQHILVNFKIAGSLRNSTPRSFTNFTASSLYSRLNFRLCIHTLRFHAEHLNSVSMKPAAGQNGFRQQHPLSGELRGAMLSFASPY
jgi:hypothetical protein